MGSSPATSGSFDDLRSLMAHRAFLYDNPDDFLAGVDAALSALTAGRVRVTADQDPHRQGWPEAQRLAP